MQKQSALLKLAAVHRGSGPTALCTCRSYRSSLPPKYLLWGHAPLSTHQNGSVNAIYRGRLSSETLPTWPTPVKQRGLAVGASDSGHTKDSRAAVDTQKDEEKRVRTARISFSSGLNAEDPAASQLPSRALWLASPITGRTRVAGVAGTTGDHSPAMAAGD